MSVFYFIQCHASDCRLRNLLYTLYNRDDMFLCHVDKKAPQSLRGFVEYLSQNFENIEELDSAFVSWGGYSQAHIMIRALERFNSLPKKYSHFVVLSEHHLAVKSKEQLSSMLENEVSFIGWTPFRKLNDAAKEDVGHRFICDYQELQAWGMYPRSTVDREGWVAANVIHGSNWTVLSRRAVDLFLSNWQQDSDLVSNLYSCIQPDEMFVQTALGEPFLDSANVRNQVLTYVAWPHLSGTTDLTFADHNLVEATKGPYAFIRKSPNVLSSSMRSHIAEFNEDLDDEAKNVFDSYNGGGSPEATSLIVDTFKDYFRSVHQGYEDITAWGVDLVPRIYFSKNIGTDVKVILISENAQDFKISCIWERVPVDYRLQRVGMYLTVLLKARVNFIDMTRELILPHDLGAGFISDIEESKWGKLTGLVTEVEHIASSFNKHLLRYANT
jgi:hypothetical protein